MCGTGDVLLSKPVDLFTISNMFINSILNQFLKIIPFFRQRRPTKFAKVRASYHPSAQCVTSKNQAPEC